jgi:hypothetical protein
MPGKALDVESLDPALKSAAWKAIKAMYDDYHAPHGLRSKEQEIREMLDKSGAHLFALAKLAARSSNRWNVQVGNFKRACLYAEEKLKAAHEITNLKDPDRGVKSWPVQKSYILHGMEDLRVPVLDYDTEYQYRKAWQAKEEASKTKQLQPRQLQITHDKQGAPRLSDLQDIFEATGMELQLVPIFAQLAREVTQAKKSQRDEVEQLFRDTMTKLHSMVKQRA